MSSTFSLYIIKLLRSLKRLPGSAWRHFKVYWRKSRRHKILVVFVSFILLCLATMYGIARWYIYSEHNVPYTMGVSFIPDYASYLGLNPEKTMDALINGLHVKNFRITSYWSDIEPSPGKYDFSQLDWEFGKADTAHAHIVLVVGLRQPRWPECHPPSWVDTSKPVSQWQPELEAFMTKVVDRYKNNPALSSYQLENEYFLKGFGTCQNFSRSRLVSEYNLVKKLDPHHPIIVGRSNNALGFPVGQPTPNEFSISVYKRVWDANVTHRYLEYPFPAWFYAFLAGVQKIFTGRDMIIGEMQAEPWPPNSENILNSSLAEQSKSLDAPRLKQRFNFAKATGMRNVYFWGAEYWYYRLTVEHDPSVWNVAKQEFSNQS